MDLDRCSTIKQRNLEKSDFENVGPLCQAVISGNLYMTKTLYEYSCNYDHSNSEHWLSRRWEDVGCARVAAVLSGDVELVEILSKSDISNTMVTAAIREAENGKFEVLRYLIERKRFTALLQHSPLYECVSSCRVKSAKFAGYPYCKWETLFVPCKRTWTMHNMHRRIIKVLAEAGLDFNKAAYGKPSPFMETISMGFLCLLYDILRYGGGVAITKKKDVEVFLNIFHIALLPSHRPSGFRRKSIRAAFILASYPLYLSYNVKFENTVRTCLATSKDQDPALRSCVTALCGLVLYRMHNATSLQHLCRAVILTNLRHFRNPDVIAHLELPKRLSEYLNLADLLHLDRDICQQMGRVPDASNLKPTSLKRCPCIPV